MSTLKAETLPPADPPKVEEATNIHQRGGMLLAFTAITVAIVGLVLVRKRKHTTKSMSDKTSQ